MKRAVQLATIATRNTQARTPIQSQSRFRRPVAIASSTARPTTTGVSPLQRNPTAMPPEAMKLQGRWDSATLRVHRGESTAGSLDRRPPGPGSAE